MFNNKNAADVYSRLIQQEEETKQGNNFGVLPDDCMHCGCCCGRTNPMSKQEVIAIKRYIKRNNIKPVKMVDRGIDSCCFLSEERLCKIYPVRPYICRIWTNPKHALVLSNGREGSPCGVPISKLNEIRSIGKNLIVFDTWEEFGAKEN